MKRLVTAVLAVLLVAGCTGVPSSTAPQTIEPLQSGSQPGTAAVPPNINSPPRTIVASFLAANVSNAAGYATARAYLTPTANSHWAPTTATGTATIIADDPTIGFYNQHNKTITVYGRLLGTLNQLSGIYTPSLFGDGGGSPVQFVFKVVCVGSPQPSSCRDGQWKISNLPPHSGLLLTDQQFRTGYQQRVLYFYDLADRTMIPDLRWSALNGAPLASWLLQALVTGPRPDLQNSVSTDTMPAQPDLQPGVVLGAPAVINIPGSSHLDPGARYRLAAEVSATLAETVSGGDMTITDGAGNPVTIPAVGGARFTAADFATSTGPTAPESTVYYLVDGRIHDDSGHALSGPLSRAVLASVALSRPQSGGPLLVAGVVGSGSYARLEVGTDVTGLRPTSVHGALSRPSFVPGTNEVWIGDGTQVYRVTVGDGQPKPQLVPIGALPGSQVLALRISPEGTRIAIVTGTGGAQQLWVGSIVRSAGSVSVDLAKLPISPPGVAVHDVAWLDPLKLFGIGHLSNSQNSSRTFESGVDGTEWTNESTGNLPSPPDYVTAATAANVWVSAGGLVWEQAGSSWVGPGPAAQTFGTAPVYLE